MAAIANEVDRILQAASTRSYASPADAAYTAAVAAAAADATAKAAAAQAAAIATAAIAAQAKADLAEITAKAYADGKVTTEEVRAIADATAKANAAQAAAVGAAAADATTKSAAAVATAAAAAQAKADLAETTAKAYADGKVTAEEARAIADATAKANAAQAAAISAAAADATAKSNAAVAAAAAAAQAKADLAETTAKAYADGKITTEEARAIADATAKANAAQAAATSAAAADATAKANVAATTADWANGLAGRPTDSQLLNNQDSIITRPGGGISNTQTPTINGALKIRLPVAGTNTMLRFSVDIYEYLAGYSCTLDIAGYVYSAGNVWYNVTARVTGGSNVEYPVRFGFDGTKMAVWIGAPGETWSYPQVRVRDVLLGYSAYDVATWENGWVISYDTAAATNVTGTVLDTYPAADWTKVVGAGRPADYATVGAPAGTYVGSNLAQDLETLAGATAKANAAQAAAVSAAAAAAQTKADLAETTAKAYADGKVTTEEARAIADATAKANAAQAAATAAAAADATAKANVASTTALWSNIVGQTNAPASNATVGAPAGTNVGSTPATTVESNAAAGAAAGAVLASPLTITQLNPSAVGLAHSNSNQNAGSYTVSIANGTAPYKLAWSVSTNETGAKLWVNSQIGLNVGLYTKCNFVVDVDFFVTVVATDAKGLAATMTFNLPLSFS